MQELPHTRSCFVCGESNPAGLQLRFHTDGRIVRTEFNPRPEHIGFRDVVHGGIISTVLDEIMVWACAVQIKQFGYCAEMTIRFQQPLRPGQTVMVIGEMVANRKNKIFDAKAELRRGDLVLATATGKYLPLKMNEANEFLPDLIGDARLIH
jgi:acyl-coenzyme A thioesterase PaaI-like protein